MEDWATRVMGLGLLAVASACATSDDSMRMPSPSTLGDGGSTSSQSSTGPGGSDSTSSAASDSETTVEPDSASGTTVCNPGQQVECPCPGGGQGAQACAADGTAFLPCECPEPPASSSGAAETTDETPEGCADLQCQPCMTCVQEPRAECRAALENCLSDKACAELVKCTNSCGNQACLQDCAAMNPSGLEGYNEFADCVLGGCPACDDGG